MQWKGVYQKEKDGSLKLIGYLVVDKEDMPSDDDTIEYQTISV